MTVIPEISESYMIAFFHHDNTKPAFQGSGDLPHADPRCFHFTGLIKIS